MSHYSVLVLHTEKPADPEEATAALLARYAENREVPRYIEATRDQALATARADIEKIRDGQYAEFLADPESYRRGVSNPRHMEYISETFPNERLPLLEDEDALWKHVCRYDDPEDRDADGNLWSTYNPESKWDWWVIGGRWNDNVIAGNIGPIVSLKKRTFAVITPDGEWHESGRMGWFGMVSNENPNWDAQFDELVAQHPAAYAVVVDVHI
ncbi:hypothetical protein [Arthrobacter woluwensis]|uniref:hypothetical protein n=1 Tax=Arthrobacter woluwensis TaxID=156980 RepID=UPI0011A568C6|nr:hypothetical protein [Arthrobacter woluwensis]